LPRQRPALGNGGCCEAGEPAEVLFDATARDEKHQDESVKSKMTVGVWDGRASLVASDALK
jgi:hypothetical protein